MQLRYRGVLRKYNPLQFSQPADDQYFQAESELHLRVLRYRSVLNLRPMIEQR